MCTRQSLQGRPSRKDAGRASYAITFVTGAWASPILDSLMQWLCLLVLPLKVYREMYTPARALPLSSRIIIFEPDDQNDPQGPGRCRALRHLDLGAEFQCRLQCAVSLGEFWWLGALVVYCL